MILAVLAVLCVPLAVAVAVLHGPRWYPLLDLAQTELRVRDVGEQPPAADRPGRPHRTPTASRAATPGR